jgi:hypothetical protein
VGGLVQHGDEKVFRTFEHAGMNGYFVEQVLLAPVSPSLPCEMAPALVLPGRQHQQHDRRQAGDQLAQLTPSGLKHR